MSKRVYRDKSEPVRENVSWNEMWMGPDQGLIQCWEVGRRLAKQDSYLAECARKGELPVLGWKGGISGDPKFKTKFGTLSYLAEWQGLRGENLDIDLDSETTITCSRTNIEMTFTSDFKKWQLPGK